MPGLRKGLGGYKKFIVSTPVDNTPTISGEELYYLENKMVGLAVLVNAKVLSTTTQFEYGTSPTLVGATVVEGDTVTGAADTIVGFITTRLIPGKYYYRVSATNAEGTTTTDITSFDVLPGVGRDLVDYSTILSNGIATMTGITYYIDPSAVTNGDGLTPETPFDSWTRLATLGGGNKYLQKRGTTYQAATGVFRGFVGACYMGVYGEGTDFAYLRAGVNTISNFVSTNYRLIIEGYDLLGYRTAGHGTEVGRGIRLSAAASGETMNHIVYNCNIHGFNIGIDGYMSGGYYYGMKVLHSRIYDIGIDGIYPQGPTDIEIAYNHIYHVNTIWYINEDDGASSGDGIQMGFANGSFPTIHLEASIHHNTIDRSDTRNKFCAIWNEQLNGETVFCYNNHLICADYATDPDHPVSAIYTSLSSGGTDAHICNTEIYNNLFEGGNYGVRNYTRASTQIHHNIFINLYIAVASGGGLNVNVHNNVFKDYTSVAIGMGSTPRVTSRNNTFHTSTLTAYAYASLSGLGASDYNNFFGARINSTAFGLVEWKAEQVYDDNSTDTDPLYVDVDKFDYHVAAGSPLINAGVDVGLNFDRAGTTIPQGAGFDVGVFEYIA